MEGAEVASTGGAAAGGFSVPARQLRYASLNSHVCPCISIKSQRHRTRESRHRVAD